MKIYVASSWRNIYQPEVVRLCRHVGHEAYDFRNPGPGDNGFGWSEIDGNWKSWDFARYRDLLKHPRAEQAFALDMGALMAADACLLVYPCGKSAHLEMGWACGAGKPTAFLVPSDIEYPRGALAEKMFKGHHLEDRECLECGSSRCCMVTRKLRNDFEPELMVKMGGAFLVGQAELESWLWKLGRP